MDSCFRVNHGPLNVFLVITAFGRRGPKRLRQPAMKSARNFLATVWTQPLFCIILTTNQQAAVKGTPPGQF